MITTSYNCSAYIVHRCPIPPFSLPHLNNIFPTKKKQFAFTVYRFREDFNRTKIIPHMLTFHNLPAPPFAFLPTSTINIIVAPSFCRTHWIWIYLSKPKRTLNTLAVNPARSRCTPSGCPTIKLTFDTSFANAHKHTHIHPHRGTYSPRVRYIQWCTVN